MKSQISRAALKLLEMTEFLVTSVRNLKSTAVAHLGEVFQDLLAGAGAPPAPDWSAVQDFNLALLTASAAEVQRTDRDHRHNRVRDRQLRRQRRHLVRVLKAGYRDLRQSFTGTYGEDALPLVGLDAPAEKRYLAVREQMREVIARMLDSELAARLPATRAGQAPIDLEALAGARQGEVEELEVTMEAIQESGKQLDASIVTRNEARRRHRRIYANVFRVQEGLYRLAGLDDLADRIRFTVPSPPTKQEEDGQDSPAETPNDSQEEPNGVA